MKRKCLIIVAILAVMCWAGSAAAFTDGISTANFSTTTIGGVTYLQVDVTQDKFFGTLGGPDHNIVSGANLLTAIFWNSPSVLTKSGAPTTPADLATGAQVAPGSNVIQFTSSPTDLGAENGYLSGLVMTGTPFASDNQGIGNAGLSTLLNGNPSTVSFGPTSLWVVDGDLNPTSPGGDGIDFAFVPTAYGTGSPAITGNKDVKGNPLVQDEEIFTFIVPAGFDLTKISDVKFNYGTALGAVVPLPPSFLLMGSGLLGLGLVGWRRRKSC